MMRADRAGYPPRLLRVLRVLCVVALAAGGSAAYAAALTSPAILRICAEADGAQHCERLIEMQQMKQFPGIAVRDGALLRLGPRVGARAIELRDTDDPDSANPAAAFRSYALWDYWPQRKMAIVSVTARERDFFLLVDLERGTQTRVAAEPYLAPDALRFVVGDLCDSECGNVIEIWRFDPDRLVREKTFKPLEKWYDAEVKWRDAATVLFEYSIATPEPRFNAAGERILVKAKPRLMKLSDWAWIDEDRKR